MRFNRRLIGLLSCLAAAAALTACGGGEELTCGPGTQAKNGACALTDDGCAVGTVLAEDDTCVPEGGACAEGTTFDAEQGKCIVNTVALGSVPADGEASMPATTIAGDETVFVTFRASADQFLELTHDNTNFQNARMTLYAADASVAVPMLNVGPFSTEYVQYRCLYQHTTGPDEYYVLEFVPAYNSDMEEATITVTSARAPSSWAS